MKYMTLTNEEGNLIQSYLPNKSRLDELSNFYFAFADTTRLKILISLCITPMCVTDLSKVLGINQSTLSHQLQLLKTHNIVTATRNKKNITYSVLTEYVTKIIECGIDAKAV